MTMYNTMSNYQTHFNIGLIIGIFIGIAVAMVLAIIIDQAPFQIEKKWQIKVIERGAAHWEINTDGNTKFVWNTEIKK